MHLYFRNKSKIRHDTIVVATQQKYMMFCLESKIRHDTMFFRELEDVVLFCLESKIRHDTIQSPSFSGAQVKIILDKRWGQS